MTYVIHRARNRVKLEQECISKRNSPRIKPELVTTIFFRICAQGLRYLAQDFLTRISQPLGSIKLVDDRLTWTCGSDSVQAVAPDRMIVEQLPIRALPVFNRTAAPEMMQLAHRNVAGQGAQSVGQNC